MTAFVKIVSKFEDREEEFVATWHSPWTVDRVRKIYLRLYAPSDILYKDGTLIRERMKHYMEKFNPKTVWIGVTAENQRTADERIPILLDTPAAKRFVDFLLSKEGQQIIADSYTLPVRSDVSLPKDSPLPNPHDAVLNAIKLDFKSMSSEKEATIKKFKDVMRPGK